ncbi:hypothetical protein F0562_012395 [Nyssa sinensis]|uniref:Endonuclease/exonuclease/phosphatase domain-containing protein n=1 Tax=Nyssa sinensis TaxID=561372 RepID=A0A5J4ZWE3_9ASTE|nr:hypothetical protein F0562_012395 [Nyssa sinensis]
MIHALHELVKREDPTVMFLIETKLLSKKLEHLKFKLGYGHGLFVDCVGRSGGLGLSWKRNVDTSILSYSNNHIDAVVKGYGGIPSWRLTAVYGCPVPAGKQKVWNLIRYLQNAMQLPWVCLEDFNEIKSLSEKRGLSDRTGWQMRVFRQLTYDCGFVDLGYKGF